MASSESPPRPSSRSPPKKDQISKRETDKFRDSENSKKQEVEMREQTTRKWNSIEGKIETWKDRIRVTTE